MNLDANAIYCSDRELSKTRMPTKEWRTLREKLLRATSCIDQRPDPHLEQCDHAFQTIFSDPDEDGLAGVDEIEVRDAFLEFMSRMMGDYKKFLKDVGGAGKGLQSVPELANSRDFFDREKFLLAKDSGKFDSFLFKLTNTTMFGCFIENRSMGESTHDAQILFFDNIQK